MRLKKITTDVDYYVVVDENADINENDFTLKNGQIREVSFLMQDNGDKIIASTKPLETIQVVNSFRKRYDKIKPLELSYVKSLFEEVDVEKKADDFSVGFPISPKAEGGEAYRLGLMDGYWNGYNQCLEYNKDKKFSEEDLRKAFNMARKHIELGINKISRAYSYTEDEAIYILTQPKDTWECEFIDGKLKLK